uniref:Integrase core domain-containing protein n=1 Tax=Cyprinus carpio carpio TaxID=630221 RepID=A0A9J7YV53_CYPCA
MLTRHSLYLQEQVQEDILQHMLTKFSLIFRNETLDLDYLLDTQELDLAFTASNHVNIPEALITGLQELIIIIHVNVSSEETSANASDIVTCTWRNIVHPRLDIRMDDLEELLHTALPVNIIVRSIKIRMPHAGYRLMKGELLASGHWMQWHRMKASMRRVNGAGILARMVQLGFIARRIFTIFSLTLTMHVHIYSKSYFFSLHNDTFFFCCCFFFFLRIELLWCDVWSAVTSKYYEILHAMVEDGVLDLSNELRLFCVHYTILPWLKSDLKCFIRRWNNHPIRTEGNLSPNQLWCIGMLQTPVVEPDIIEQLCQQQTSDTPLEDGVVVPEIQCPLSEQSLAILQGLIDPLTSSLNDRELYVQSLDIIQRLCFI